MISLQNSSAKGGLRAVGSVTKRTGRLGRKLVVQILLINALLSVFASSIQLIAGYQRDRRAVLDEIAVIDTRFRSGFEDALWEYNFPLVEALLDGVFSKPDVHFLQLTTEQGQTWQLGDLKNASALLESLEFTYANRAGQSYPVGALQVGLTFQNIQARVWSQLWVLLLSNFVKTIMASILLFLLFQYSVGRHMGHIAARVSQTSWTDTDAPLVLDRTPPEVPDDLDQIVHAINSARAASRKSLEDLTREVDQRRTAEHALRQRSEALVNANREQAQFTYAISHDLKSPANTIAMLLQELDALDGAALSVEGKDVLQDATRTVARMTQLVEDILGYARTIEQGLQMEVVDLNTMIGEVIEDLRGDIVNAQAEINVGKLPVIDGNSGQLRMLFQNLLSNAIKFRDPGRIPRIAITAEVADTGNEVKIAVSDNGIGIPPAYHDRVFELFQRLHSYSEYHGSGLGLTLCKRIVINHLGHISLASAPGEGTTFEVTLPRRDRDG